MHTPGAPKHETDQQTIAIKRSQLHMCRTLDRVALVGGGVAGAEGAIWVHIARAEARCCTTAPATPASGPSQCACNQHREAACDLLRPLTACTCTCCHLPASFPIRSKASTAVQVWCTGCLPSFGWPLPARPQPSPIHENTHELDAATHGRSGSWRLQGMQPPAYSLREALGMTEQPRLTLPAGSSQHLAAAAPGACAARSRPSRRQRSCWASAAAASAARASASASGAASAAGPCRARA